MPISWNEIRHNAIGFAKEWAGETREEAEHWLETEVDSYIKEFGGTPEEVVKLIQHNLGYMAGYHSDETAKKMRDLFSARHPGFGGF